MSAKHAGHHRLVDKTLLEHDAVARVMQRLHERHAHQGGRPRSRSRGRVSCTISMMVRTPLPSSPTRQAKAFANSTSDDAFERCRACP